MVCFVGGPLENWQNVSSWVFQSRCLLLACSTCVCPSSRKEFVCVACCLLSHNSGEHKRTILVFHVKIVFFDYTGTSLFDSLFRTHTCILTMKNSARASFWPFFVTPKPRRLGNFANCHLRRYTCRRSPPKWI
jgi:hypothetical protein